MSKIIINGEVVNFGQSGGGTQTVSDSYIINAPIGVIVQWSGTVNTVPDGWAVCDGTNGTLDLRDKFVLAAGEGHEVGETGGSEEVTLTVAQMPEHNHIEYLPLTGLQGSSYLVNDRDGGTLAGRSINQDATTSGKGLTRTSTAKEGSGEPHPNMPPYYALLFIQKIGVTPSDYVTEERVKEIIEENSGPSLGIYSEEETRIGTWIDGKPLYRKVLQTTSPSASTGGTFILQNEIVALNIDTPVLTRGLIKNGDQTYQSGWSGGDWFVLRVNRKQGLAIRLTTGGAYNSPMTIILEYTKTTD